MVNAAKAQKVCLELIRCAMNQDCTYFNRVHEIIHGVSDDTSEEEVQETNDIINFLADWFRSKNMPRLTVLINSDRHAMGVGRGFWKNLGVAMKVDTELFMPMYTFFRMECYAYFDAFCGHSAKLQERVLQGLYHARRDESVNSAEIMLAVTDQVEFFARASTSNEQIHLPPTEDALIPQHPHRDFFINMSKWLDRACHANDTGHIVWDMEFVRGALRKLRREFTLTLPIGPEHKLFSLTLARELKENQAYMATIEEIEMVTVCNIDHPGQAMIEHTPVSNGKLVTSQEGARRNMCGVGMAGVPAVICVVSAWRVDTLSMP
ncbi:hypothetical protein FDI21_gp177 [Pseudomonas phage Noxifer]|uniref:Uncharacterized protein n=1 Tax=Pseudomonas phage Noxifer TaxID=2006684 RepID=A0A1Y0T084_9CAUD|nr:hypothetical protein FDI21_gp177 [Pseudomonas phage Noxifer]ARV77346.1 hypothetical protein NOXIFER_177 [Pseudomonas phage Noxifer]